jgi:hypothetical protein
LAAAIKKQIGLEADLVEGAGGILEVWAGDSLVFTNKGEAAEKYPGDDEMVRKLQNLSPSDTKTVQPVIPESSDDGNAPSCSIEPPPFAPSPPPERRTEIDRMTFACSCAPVPGPEGCTCRN